MYSFSILNPYFYSCSEVYNNNIVFISMKMKLYISIAKAYSEIPNEQTIFSVITSDYYAFISSNFSSFNV